MNTQQVGLTVMLRDLFSNPAKNLNQQARSLTDNIETAAKRMQMAWDKTADNTTLAWAAIKAAAVLYSVDRFIKTTTEAYNEQTLALIRLESVTNRWGRNAAAINRNIAELTGGGGFTTAGASTATANLLQGRFNEAQSRQMLLGLRDIAAAAGAKNIQETVQQVTAGLQTGNIGALEALNIPNLAMRLQLRGVNASDLNDPFRAEYARKVLFSELTNEFKRARGAYLDYRNTLVGATNEMNVSLRQMYATVGEALAPILTVLAQLITKVAQAIEEFAKQHPLVTQMAIALTILGAALFVIWPLTLKVAAAWKALGFFGIEALAGILFVLAPLLAALAILGIAWKANIFGIGDQLSRWGDNVMLVFKGATEIIRTMTGDVSTLSYKTYQALQRAGLLNLVLNIGFAFYTLKNAAKAFWEGLVAGITPVVAVFKALFEVIGWVFSKLAEIEPLFGQLTPVLNAAKIAGFALGIVLTALAAFGIVALITAIPALVAGLWSIVSPLLIALVVFEGVYDFVNLLVIAFKNLAIMALNVAASFERFKGDEATADRLDILAGKVQDFQVAGLGDREFGGSLVAKGYGYLREKATIANEERETQREMKIHPESQKGIASALHSMLRANPLQATVDGSEAYKNGLFQSAMEEVTAGGGVPNR